MGLFMMIFRWSKCSIARAGNIHLRLLGGQYVPRYSAGDEGRRGVILGKNLGTPRLDRSLHNGNNGKPWSAVAFTCKVVK